MQGQLVSGHALSAKRTCRAVAHLPRTPISASPDQTGHTTGSRSARQASGLPRKGCSKYSMFYPGKDLRAACPDQHL